MKKTATKEQGRPGKGDAPERASQHTADPKPTLASAQAAITATLADAEKRTGKPVGKMSAKEQAAANSGEGYQLLPVADIGRSPWNREDFDHAKLEELTASVRERGVIQPILVRKNPGYSLSQEPNGGPWHVTSAGGTDVSGPVPRNVAETMQRDLNFPTWEIIAGERRWKAATAARLTEIRAIVRIADDTTAIEEQAIENMQREDLNPIDEAEKYHQLLTAYKSGEEGNAIEMLCAKVQRSKALVYERMKLLKLPDFVRDAIRSGRLPASHAALITKIDHPEVQAEVAEKILKPKAGEVDDEEGEEDGRPLSSRLTVMSFRNAKWLVERTTADQEAKKAYNKAKEEFTLAKRKILTAKEVKKIMPYGYPSGGEFIRAEDHAFEYDRSGKKTWAQLLGKNAPEPVLGHDQHGAPVILLQKKDVVAALRVAGIKKPAAPKQAPYKKSAEEIQREEAHSARMVRFEAFRGEIVTKIQQAKENQVLTFIMGLLASQGACFDYPEISVAFGWPEDPDSQSLVTNLSAATVRQIRSGLAQLLVNDAAPDKWAKDWNPGLYSAAHIFGLKLPPWDVQTSGRELKEAA